MREVASRKLSKLQLMGLEEGLVSLHWPTEPWGHARPEIGVGRVVVVVVVVLVLVVVVVVVVLGGEDIVIIMERDEEEDRWE